MKTHTPGNSMGVYECVSGEVLERKRRSIGGFQLKVMKLKLQGSLLA